MPRSMILKLGAVGLVAVLAVGVAGWYFLLRSNAPPPVSLDAALAGLDNQATPAASGPAGQAPPSQAAESGLVGTWSLVRGANSFVGYRVEEQLAGIGATTAVGRTNSLEGTLMFDGSQVTRVEVTADVRTLQSDNSLRDGQLRTQALESNRFPTATFVLTSPIAIGAVPREGESVSRTVTGDLTLHGVTRPITMEVQGVMRDGLVVVVGSTIIRFADFNIAQPRAATVLSVADHGTLELQLVFQKA